MTTTVDNHRFMITTHGGKCHTNWGAIVFPRETPKRMNLADADVLRGLITSYREIALACLVGNYGMQKASVRKLVDIARHGGHDGYKAQRKLATLCGYEDDGDFDIDLCRHVGRLLKGALDCQGYMIDGRVDEWAAYSLYPFHFDKLVLAVKEDPSFRPRVEPTDLERVQHVVRTAAAQAAHAGWPAPVDDVIESVVGRGATAEEIAASGVPANTLAEAICRKAVEMAKASA